MDITARRERRDFGRQLRRNPTDAEQRLWYYLRGRRLSGHRFRRQRPIGPYFADFVCLERRLMIELDGGQHAEAGEYDGRRTRSLGERGFAVLRLWDREVLLNPQEVLAVIQRALEEPARVRPVRPSSRITRPGS